MEKSIVRVWMTAIFGLGVAGTSAAQITLRVSLTSSGGQSNGISNGPCLSAEGRYVAFYSDASNLVAGDTNAVRDVFVRDRWLGTTERVSVDSSGNQGNGLSGGSMISADGRWVVFHSDATN